ncbi:hypothetical protein JNUCC83_10395 [Vagococcus sp. JNUCC 83]
MINLSIFIGIIAFILSVLSIYMIYKINKKMTKQVTEISKLSAKIESFIFMTQKQYEKEYNLYWNVFDLLQKTIDKTMSIRGTLQLLRDNSEDSLEETYIKLIQESIIKSSELLNELDNLLNQYEPFIQKKLFDCFKLIVKDLRGFQQRRFNYFSYETVSNDSIENFIADIDTTLDNVEKNRMKIVRFLRKKFKNTIVS